MALIKSNQIFGGAGSAYFNKDQFFVAGIPPISAVPCSLKGKSLKASFPRAVTYGFPVLLG